MGPFNTTLHSHNTVGTIPENLPLTDSEKSVLSKGLNFVPITKRTNEFSIKQDVEKFFRHVQLKAFFHDKEDDSDTSNKDIFETLLVRKSKWTSPQGQFASLDFFTKKCRHDIHKLKFNRNTKFSNLSSEEWVALKNLSKRNNIVVKSADKGGAVVVWRSDLYQKEALWQLSDTSFYAKIPKDLTSKNQKLVKDTIQNLIVNQELPDTATNLIINTPRTSCIYFLPKIHKPNNPGRPIVSACSCPTELISSYLDRIMTPIVKSLPSYIKDSTHALQIFRDFNFSGKDKLIFTMDITSLYTVIPNSKGLQALKHFFNALSKNLAWKRLAELVVTLNCFSFAGNCYKQINGVAIGTRMGPSYANLFVGYVEHQFFNQYNGPKPQTVRPRCKTCLFIVNTSKISGPKRSVRITDRFTCTSANVIYCINCTLCNKLYIGETGRRLGDRFREHLRGVEKNDKDASKPVARHFNLPNHSKKHMAICGLSLHLGRTESRKNLEQKFIFQIGTLNPHGINERFSFN